MNAMTDLSRLHPPPVAALEVHSATAADTVYGVLRIGAAHIALPLDVLREVIPCPPQFSGLPASAPGLLGAISVRGRVLPVLDLRVVLGRDAPRHDGQVVVVMRQAMPHGGALLGLMTDGVSGLTRLPAKTLNAMSSGSDTLLFSGSFERAEDHNVVSVLDAAAVMRLPGVPLLQDDSGASATAATSTASVPRCPLMLVRCGDVRLAMDVTDIHTTLPRVTLHPSSMDGRVCRGVIEHAGVRLPAIDPLALMSLGTLPEGELCQALLLRFPGGLVAVLVSQVIDIVRVPETELLALSPLAVQRPEFFRAALRVPSHGDHLVLERGALQYEPELLALSTLNATPGAAGSPTASAATTAVAIAHARGSAVITYDIGPEVATRLTQVIEVLPLPADHARPASGHPAVIGMFTHRGHSVTLICLSSLLESSARPDPLHARVLVVSTAGAHFGFVVPHLRHIESTVWEAPRKDNSAAARRSALGRHALVEIGTGAQRRTLHLVDLHGLAQALMRCKAETVVEDDASLEALAVE